jgi:hypothetical protein
MGLIALFALELALLRPLLWLIVIFPPVTMGIISANLAVLNALRWLPRSMGGRTNGMLCGGMIALFVLVLYHLLTVSPGGLGFIGKAIAQFLINVAAARADLGDSSLYVRLGARAALPAEIVVLDLLGIACIWAGGWIARGWPTTGADHPSPLDDRGVTPV